MSTQVTLNISNIQNNNVPCKDPVVLILGATGEIAFPCGDKMDKDGNIKLTLPTSEFANNCIQVVVKCDECGHCPEEERTICLCETGADCPNCSQCVEGICISKCSDGEFCKDNTCVECDENNPCPKGFACINGTCICLGKVNDKGECVECLGNGDCGQCETCQNNQCIEKVCPNNLTCIGGDCSCPPGTKYDVVTNSCIPVGCDNDSQCGECETCVANNCQPIVCPDGYKCVNGECIPWGCVNTTCNNGADCGENCGCLNGECVPCYLLECTGECAEALGCKCNTNTDKCEPVDNCGNYCDGSTPCLDQNCTCYNNTCVSCENFPCVDGEGGCDSYYNCGCTNGDCGGGKGCQDKLELIKIENCPTECALEATFTTDNNCFCDPIEFRVRNIKNCNISDPRSTGIIMNLVVKAYKNGRPYENYLNEITIGDDELLNVTIKTKINFFTKNVSGVWVPETVNAVQVPEVSALGNTFDTITISNGNIGFNTQGIVQTNRKAEIIVTAVGVKVPANDCVLYGDKLIASYTLDFTDAFLTCNQVESYKAEQKTILTDNDSSRRPLFIWSKSNTGTFSPDKYIPSTNYNNNGWFRKEYGEKIGSVWSDKVSTTADGLWNNLNYKVTVDCGCKSNTANLEKVVFCCPTEFKYNLEQCGRKITILPFDTCEVNRKLLGTNPKEVQTLYYVTLNGTDYLLRPGGGNLLQNFVKELEVPITSIVFSQRYEGTPIVAKACDVEYTEEVNAPDFNLEAECGKITVTQIGGTNPIVGVKTIGSNLNFTKVNTTTWTLEVPKVNSSFDVAATFQNSCVFVKTIDIVCQQVVTAEPTSLVAKGECQNGGSNPNILLEAVAGFTGEVEFFDPRAGKGWFTQTGTNPQKITFNNFASGTYTFTTRQKSDNSVTANVSVTIYPPVELVLSATPACGLQSGKLILTGVMGSIWNVTGAGFNAGGTQVTIPPSGVLELQVLSANAGGAFTATFVSDATGKSCGGTKTVIVPKDGGNIVISMEASDVVCKGSPASFKVNDGGLGLTYNLTASNGVTFIGVNGNKIIGGIYYKAFYNGTLGNFTLTASIDNTVSGCYTSNTVSKTIVAKDSPIISSISECFPGHPGKYIVTATWDNRVGTAILDDIHIAVGSSTLPMFNNPSGSNTYTADNVNAFLSGSNTYQIGATYNGCTTSLTDVPFVNCEDPNNCPPLGEPTIVANPQFPCAVQTSNLIYSGGTAPENGDTYSWIETTSGLDVVIATGIVTTGTIPNLTITAELTEKTYKLAISKLSGACTYESQDVQVQAQSSQNVTIYGPGISPDTQTLQTGTLYTFFTDIVPGASYNWILSNPGGAVTNLGSTYTISTALLAGASIITVEVTVDGCTYTKSENLNVGTNCAGTINIALVGAGSDSCKDLSGTISGILGTVDTWVWKVDGVPTQNGTGTITNFNTNSIASGDTVNITLEVTTSTGCLIVSSVFEYTRCGCMCDTSNICKTTIVHNGIGGQGVITTLPEYPAGKQLRFLTVSGNVDLNIADRYKIVVTNGGSTTILDTGYPHTVTVPNMATCPGINYPSAITDLSAATLGSDVSANLITAINPVIISNLTTINLTMDYTVVAGDIITILHNDPTCTDQQGWRVDVTCLN